MLNLIQLYMYIFLKFFNNYLHWLTWVSWLLQDIKDYDILLVDKKIKNKTVLTVIFSNNWS